MNDGELMELESLENAGSAAAYSEAGPPRPFLTTPFEEYTVMEGFQLLFLVCIFIAAIYQVFRRFV